MQLEKAYYKVQIKPRVWILKKELNQRNLIEFKFESLILAQEKRWRRT